MQEIKIYNKNDKCFNKIKRVDIYNSTKKLFEQYYIYFKQIPITGREYCGIDAAKKINNLLDMTCIMYFSKKDFSIEKFILTLKCFEFKIREMYTIGLLPKTKYLILSKMIADLGIILNNFKEENELRQ